MNIHFKIACNFPSKSPGQFKSPIVNFLFTGLQAQRGNEKLWQNMSHKWYCPSTKKTKCFIVPSTIFPCSGSASWFTKSCRLWSPVSWNVAFFCQLSWSVADFFANSLGVLRIFLPTLLECCGFFCPLSWSVAVFFAHSLGVLRFFPTLLECCGFIGPLSWSVAVFFAHSLGVLRFFCPLSWSVAVFFAHSLGVLRFFLPTLLKCCGFQPWSKSELRESTTLWAIPQIWLRVVRFSKTTLRFAGFEDGGYPKPNPKCLAQCFPNPKPRKK